MNVEPIMNIGRLIVVVYLLGTMVFTVSSIWAQPTGQISPDMMAIQGRWIRTDAPYIIELNFTWEGSL